MSQHHTKYVLLCNAASHVPHLPYAAKRVPHFLKCGVQQMHDGWGYDKHHHLEGGYKTSWRVLMNKHVICEHHLTSADCCCLE